MGVLVDRVEAVWACTDMTKLVKAFWLLESVFITWVTIIIMISHITRNQLYHIISSWTLIKETRIYQIISKTDIETKKLERGYWPEQFRSILSYWPELYRSIISYWPEQFRSIIPYWPEPSQMSVGAGWPCLWVLAFCVGCWRAVQ